MRTRALPYLAVTGLTAGIALTILIGLLGPSAMVPHLAGPPGQPPYALGLGPGPHLAIALGAAALVTGALGLAAGLAALARGWSPNARRLLLAGCLAAVVLAFLPPSGSADHLNYAAYGRIAALGLDPYQATPAALPADPVAAAVEEWRDTPSVYGPAATAVQFAASLVGGTSVRLTVFAMELVNAAAFVAVAVLLHRYAAPADRARAALLWAANPLVIYHLAAGMHVDTLAVAAVVAALAAGGPAWRDAPPYRLAGAGALLGLGVAVKVNAGLAALGPAWALRPWRRDPVTGGTGDRVAAPVGSRGREAGGATAVPASVAAPAGGGRVDEPATPEEGTPGQARAGQGVPWRAGRLAVVAGVAVAVAGAGYLLAGPYVLDQVSRATEMVSLATPWALVKGWLQALFGPGGYRSWIRAGSLALLVLLAVLLARALREPYRLTGTGGDPAPGAAAVVVAAWLVAAPYALPWYDGLLFALLAMVPATALDGFAVARLAVLSLGYLPARQAGRPEDLEWLVTGVRATVVPWILLALTVALAGWAWRAGSRARTRRG